MECGKTKYMFENAIIAFKANIAHNVQIREMHFTKTYSISRDVFIFSFMTKYAYSED